MRHKFSIFNFQFSIFLFFSVFLILLLLPTTNNAPILRIYQLPIAYAACSSSTRADGLISASGIIGKFGTTAPGGACINNDLSSLLTFKIPSYFDLKQQYYTNSKAFKEDIGALSVITDQHIYHVPGNLTLDLALSGSGTAVIFVDGELNVPNNITYGNNTSGLVFIVGGDIRIAPTVTRVDAIFISSGYIYTGANPGSNCTTTPGSALTVNGNLVSLNKDRPIRFCRTLGAGDNLSPAEVINQQPKYLVILRDLFSQSLSIWSEITGVYTPPASPTVNLKVAHGNTFVDGPVTKNTNSTVFLQWTLTGSPTACEASGAWSGAKSTITNSSDGNNTALPNGTYTFTISCSSTGGTASDSVIVNITDPPPAPSGLTATANNTQGIALDWNDFAGADSYKVYFCMQGACPQMSLLAVSVFQSNYSNTFLCGTTYQFKVRATNISGDSADSTTTSVVTSACPPNGITIVDNGNVSGDTSIRNPSDGLPVISYYASNTLKVLKCGNESCNSGNVTNAPDPTPNNVGRYNSLTIPSDGLPVISYYDVTGLNLKFIKCANTSCSSGTSRNLDTAGDVGKYTSIAIGSDGLPVIAYYDATGLNLKVIKCGTLDCASGNIITAVDTAGDVGQYTSISIPTGGYPVISYYDVSNTALKFVKCTNNTCSTFSTPSILDGASTPNVGQFSSIRVPSDGNPVISYRNSTNLDLMVLKCGNASCSAGNTITTADALGDVGKYTSLAIGSGGFPVISYSYYDAGTGSSDLKILKCGNAACSSGNTISTAPDSVGSVGQYSSIAIGNNGLPVISYYADINTDLKVYKCLNSACTPYTPPPPSAPNALSATAISTAQIDLSWIGSPTAASYTLYGCFDAGCAPGQFSHPGLTTTTYSEPMNCGRVLRVKARAVNLGGNSPDSNIAEATTPPCP